MGHLERKFCESRKKTREEILSGMIANLAEQELMLPSLLGIPLALQDLEVNPLVYLLDLFLQHF
jgi:hypothetical protein